MEHVWKTIHRKAPFQLNIISWALIPGGVIQECYRNSDITVEYHRLGLISACAYHSRW